MLELIDFDKDDAAQELLGYAAITEPYEDLISRVSLEILRESVPDCVIESIRYVRPAGRHPSFRVGGMPIEEDPTKIAMQDMTMPFDLEIIVCSGGSRDRLEATFRIESRKMDEDPENEFHLEIHRQQSAEQVDGPERI